MDLTAIINNSVASLEEMLETVDQDETSDITRMSLYSQILIMEYHKELSKELAKQGIKL